MSGASAVASARRRRADPQPQTILPPGSQINNNENIRRSEEVNQEQSVTPLQILKIHDNKLKELDVSLRENVENIVKEFLNNTNKDKPKEEKSFDSSYLLNKINDLNTKLEELKILVIKNQNLSLETNNEMLKMKDNINDLKDNIVELEKNINLSNDEDTNLFNMGSDENGSAEMLIRSMLESSGMMGSSISKNMESEKLNIHDNESDKSNDIDDIGEITLTESDLASIKTDVINEIKEELINLDEKKAELIEVSENESQE
tara:strand:+ start:4363 stop:5145 length:783 start_codon:yes stop_codon:yes gene_type:complete